MYFLPHHHHPHHQIHILVFSITFLHWDLTSEKVGWIMPQLWPADQFNSHHYGYLLLKNFKTCFLNYCFLLLGGITPLLGAG